MKPKPEIDSINVILEECIMAYPLSAFVISLYKQYLSRGSLSKKQLEGLYGKAAKIEGLAPGKLAALEAIIKKMPTRFKSEKPENKPLYEKDQSVMMQINSVLEMFPVHKTVLFLKSKYENNEPLSTAELAQLKKLKELVDRKKAGI